MKRFIFASIIAMIAVLSISATVAAQNYTGLWVGNATLKYVSEVNKSYSDLSFDLGLQGVLAHETLIGEKNGEKDAWSYNDTGTDLGFPDPGWTDDPTKKAPYGILDSRVITPVSSQTTIYFRKEFSVSLPKDVETISDYYSNLNVRLWRDDGIVLYLNGEEVFRNNLPAGAIDTTTYANSEIKESQTEDNSLIEFSLPPTLIQDGSNLIEAEVHQASGSTDLLFDMELIAIIKDPVIEDLMNSSAGDWQYDDSGTDHRSVMTDTALSSCSATGWPEAAAPFGYGGEAGWSSISQATATVYFCRNFSKPTESKYTHLRLLLLRDDGAVVYINGEEILRSNMPPEPDPIDHDTAPVAPVGAVNEGRYQVVDVDLGDFFDNGGQLINGDNVVAVEVHQHPAELNGSGAPQLTRTPATFDLRLMLHVDDSGAVKLLKEVIQMYDSDAKDYVLLTNHEKVTDYDGVAVRDGEPVGRRLSAVGFGFQGTYIDCGSGISPTGKVTCTFDLLSAHPTNPFLHRYHPDHDNMDERYVGTVEEAYKISRNMTLDFDTRYPPDVDLDARQVKPAGWGDSLLGGTYTETLKGLHKYTNGIIVSGPFTLRRVVTTNYLIE